MSATWFDLFRKPDGSVIACAMDGANCVEKYEGASVEHLTEFFGSHPKAKSFLLAPPTKPVPPLNPEEDGWCEGWVPFAKQSKKGACKEIATRFTYPNGGPVGAIVHFSADNATGPNLVSYLASKPYPCLVIDREGVLWQGFPLTRGGSHSGTPDHDSCVGIEVIAAGKLKEMTLDGEKRYAAYFHREPEEWFKPDQVRYFDGGSEQFAGWYQIYSPAQEATLKKLILWLRKNSPANFDFNRVIGHDESCCRHNQRGRKNDPGGALSMSMPEYRKYLASL